VKAVPTLEMINITKGMNPANSTNMIAMRGTTPKQARFVLISDLVSFFI
jgi:hypothetical protein